MLMPVVAEVFGNIGITKDDVGFICSGSTDYLIGGPFSFVAALDAVGVWPPRAESHVEMDGAWALYEAWVLLQEGEIDAALVYSFGRSSMGDLSEILSRPARPLLPGPAVAGPYVAGRPAGPGNDRRGQGHRGRLRRGGQPVPPGCSGQPQGPGGLRPLARGAAGRGLRGGAACAGTRCRRSPTAAPPSCWRPATGPTSGASGRRSSPASTTASRRTRSAPATSPLSPSTKLAGEKAGVGAKKVDVAELHAPYAHQELIVAEALGLGDGVDRQPLGWRAGGQPDDVGRPHPHRRGGPGHLVGAGRPCRGPRHVGARACNRTWSASWRVCDGRALRSHRGGPDGGQVQARGRLDRRAGARGGPGRARGRRARPSPTSTPSSSARHPTCSRAS